MRRKRAIPITRSPPTQEAKGVRAQRQLCSFTRVLRETAFPPVIPPSPVAQVTAAVPQPRPTGRFLSGLRPGALPAWNSRQPGLAGHSPAPTFLWDDPGSWVSSPKRDKDALDRYDSWLGPKMYLEWLKRGWGRGEAQVENRETIPIFSPGPLLPSVRDSW